MPDFLTSVQKFCMTVSLSVLSQLPLSSDLSYCFLGVVTASLSTFLKLPFSWIPCYMGPKPVVLRTGKVKACM